MIRVISAFPGCGKTHFHNKHGIISDYWTLDSDSSKFDKANFPQNYLEHIKKSLENKCRFIFVSSHKPVREELVKEGIKFALVYPDIKLKDEYIQRYKDCGSNETFVKLLETNYENWITELTIQGGCEHIVLQSGQYLSDVIEKIKNL